MRYCVSIKVFLNRFSTSGSFALASFSKVMGSGKSNRVGIAGLATKITKIVCLAAPGFGQTSLDLKAREAFGRTQLAKPSTTSQNVGRNQEKLLPRAPRFVQNVANKLVEPRASLKKQGLSKREPLFVQTSARVVSRQDLYSLSNEKSKQLYFQAARKDALVLGDMANRAKYKLTNALHLRPLQSGKGINGRALRRAVTEVKPCMDLRQLRRGRKVLQIPRIIPATKRHLFGVRRLLSILTSTRRQNTPALRSSTATHRAKEGVTDENRVHVTSSRIGSLSKPSVPQGLETDYQLSSTNREPRPPQATLLPTSTVKRFQTRVALFGRNRDATFLSLSNSLRSEIRGSSQSRSRSIENKKRIYRTASANRGSIRMAWWL